MARATPSLPVPLSPWMSTVAELSATCCTSVIICFQVGLTPIRLSWRSIVQALLERGILLDEGAALQGLAHHAEELRALERLGEEVDGAVLHGAHRLFHGAEGGEDDHIHVGGSRFCLLQELEARETRHL